MTRFYRVEVETDPTLNQFCVTLPTLNDTADFGDTLEEALENLHTLAAGFIEVLLDRHQPVPPSDPIDPEGLLLVITVEQPVLAPA